MTAAPWSAFLPERDRGRSQPDHDQPGSLTTFNSRMPCTNGKTRVCAQANMSEKIQHEVVEHWWCLGGLGKSLPFFQPISPLSTNAGLTQGQETSEWPCWSLANVWKRTRSSPAGSRRASPPKRLPVAIRESRCSLAGQSTRLSLRRWQACCLALITPPGQSNARQQHFPNKTQSSRQLLKT